MRNISEYPLTTIEAFATLEILRRRFLEERLFGDMRPYTMQLVADFLVEHAEEFDKYCKENV